MWITSLSRLPAAAGTTSSLIATFSATASEILDAATVNVPAAWDLRAAGADELFDTADDLVYDLQVSPAYTTGTEVELLVVDGPPAPGHYRLMIAATVQDLVGNALDGNGDGVGSDAFVYVFDVALPADLVFEGSSNDDRAGATSLALVEDPAGSGHFVSEKHGAGSIDPETDEDWWTFPALAGDRVAIWVDCPPKVLIPYVYLYADSGGSLAYDYYAGPGYGAYVSDYEIPADGTYYVRVDYYSGVVGNYQVHVELARGIDVESDGNYANGSFAGTDPLTLVQSGASSTASVAGTVMTPELLTYPSQAPGIRGCVRGRVGTQTCPVFVRMCHAFGTRG